MENAAIAFKVRIVSSSTGRVKHGQEIWNVWMLGIKTTPGSNTRLAAYCDCILEESAEV